MRHFFILAAACTVLTLVGCKKENDIKADMNANANELSTTEVSADELSMIKAAGFSTEGVTKNKDGYIVEGDMLLTAEQLRSFKPSVGTKLIVANAEHYRTYYIVGYLPRTISIRYYGSVPNISTALNYAINRYNNLGLRIRFQRVSATSAAHITIYDDANLVNFIAYANFPSGNGNPGPYIRFNPYYGRNWSMNTLITTLTHEIGHTIGFRHTDWMNRYSCPSYQKEVDAAGAYHIPGTPTYNETNSWMTACIENGTDRQFTYNDRVALNYVY